MKNRLFIVLVMLLSMIVTAFGQESDDKYAVANRLLKEGLSLHDKGQYDDAIKKYDEVLKLKSDFYPVMSEKALSLYALNKKSEAKKLLEKLMKKAPKDFDFSHAYLLYANIMDEEGDQLKALETYDKAMEDVDVSNTDLVQQIWYNKAVVLYKLTDENKKKVPEWEDDLANCLIESLRLKPYHARSLSTMGAMMEKYGNYLNAFCCYAIFAMATDGAADMIEPQLLAWKDMELTPKTGPRTTKTLNKVKEVLKKEPSEYGRLYDLFSEVLPLACPDSLKSPVPVNYAGDIFEDGYCPFFAELQRSGLLECFCHSVMKNSKSKYISNADWLSRHKDEEKRFQELFSELPVFATGIESGFVPDSVVVNTAEEAHEHNLDAMFCCRYYLRHFSTDEYMDDAARFITQWSMASPDVTIKIGEPEKIFLDKPVLLVSYLAGSSFAALTSRGLTPVEIYKSGISEVLTRYSLEKETIGQTEELDNFLKSCLDDGESFWKTVEENFTK